MERPFLGTDLCRQERPLLAAVSVEEFVSSGTAASGRPILRDRSVSSGTAAVHSRIRDKI